MGSRKRPKATNIYVYVKRRLTQYSCRISKRKRARFLICSSSSSSSIIPLLLLLLLLFLTVIEMVLVQKISDRFLLLYEVIVLVFLFIVFTIYNLFNLI